MGWWCFYHCRNRDLEGRLCNIGKRNPASEHRVHVCKYKKGRSRTESRTTDSLVPSFALVGRTVYQLGMRSDGIRNMSITRRHFHRSFRLALAGGVLGVAQGLLSAKHELAESIGKTAKSMAYWMDALAGERERDPPGTFFVVP